MLVIKIPDSGDMFDEKTKQFVTVKGQTLELEHSLASVSKWESQYEKPFLGKEEKTIEETVAYIKAMCLTENIDSTVFTSLTSDSIKQISNYIDKKATATTFFDPPGAQRSSAIITSEIIYYWMVSLQIPFECQYWHLNKLLALIRVINLKNAPSKKLSRSEIARRNQMLNSQRKSQLNTSG